MGKLETLKNNHAVSRIGYHVVFCPKFRHKIFEDDLLKMECQRILAQTCQTYGWKLLECAVEPDHVHLFVQTPHTDAPVNVVKTLKSTSALHLFTHFPKLKKDRFWGTGMWSRGAFYASVGDVTQETITRYIQEQ